MKKKMLMLLAGVLLFSAVGCAPASDLNTVGGSEESTLSSIEITDAPFITESEESDWEESTETSEPEPTVSHVGMTALADVPNYVNVRTGPTTEDEIVGKIYNYCAAEILDEVKGEDGNWFLIRSGNCEGYIKSEFFLVGEEAEAMLPTAGVMMGTVKEDYLRVRSEPDLENLDNVFTHYRLGTEVYIEELTDDGWAKIEADDAATGYVYAECLDIRIVFRKAITIEEEEEKIAKQKAREEAARLAEEEYQRALEAERLAKEEEERRRQQQNQNPTQPTNPPAPPVNPADPKSALRSAVCAYALQYVGCPYVHGGRQITATDCSGFTHYVYEHFGYSLPFTPEHQPAYGARIHFDNPMQNREANLAKLLPGDLVFFTSSYKEVGHVGIYLGNGQFIHAANEQLGVIVVDVFYREPLFAVRIIN